MGSRALREERDEKLFLLVALDLPLDEVADVHHCRDGGNKTGYFTRALIGRTLCAIISSLRGYFVSPHPTTTLPAALVLQALRAVLGKFRV